VIKVKQYIDLRKDAPFFPVPIEELPKPVLTKQPNFSTEEEMKESMPNEFETFRSQDPDHMQKYAFFDDEKDVSNFNILRRVGGTNKDTSMQMAEQAYLHNNGSGSPRLPTDFEFDDDLATHKLSQLNFKRPPSPHKNPLTQEKEDFKRHVFTNADPNERNKEA
jgi:hypothetical protein